MDQRERSPVCLSIAWTQVICYDDSLVSDEKAHVQDQLFIMDVWKPSNLWQFILLPPGIALQRPNTLNLFWNTRQYSRQNMTGLAMYAKFDHMIWLVNWLMSRTYLNHSLNNLNSQHCVERKTCKCFKYTRLLDKCFFYVPSRDVYILMYLYLSCCFLIITLTLNKTKTCIYSWIRLFGHKNKHVISKFHDAICQDYYT